MKAIGRFWSRPEGDRPVPAIPAGVRLYAIGDVHGRDDLLDNLLTKIEGDTARRGPARTILVFLGDLIDRGPASAAVVERLRTYRHEGVETVFLTGNHEEVLLRILDGEDGLIADWLKFGGRECLASYGVDIASLPASAGQAGSIIRDAIPPSHQAFFRSFTDTFRAGDYCFVHAGIRPGVPIADQTAADLRWIRQPFLEWSNPHEAMIVHGHTITSEVEVTAARIGIDTGAYRSGILTALGTEGRTRWFIKAQSASVMERRR